MNNKNHTFKWVDRDQAIAAAARFALLKISQSDGLYNPVRTNEIISNSCKQMVKNKTLAINGANIPLLELDHFISDTKCYFNKKYN